MNHTFTPKALTPQLCATCERSIVAHGKNAQCEACSYVGPCDVDKVLTNNMLLCPECKAKEIQANTSANRDAIEAIRSYGDYFNARVTPIVALKEMYELNGKTFADFHAHIKEQIEHFARVLFQSQIETREDTISKLLIEFRAEVRTQIKQNDINYQPPSKAPKVGLPKKRLSPIEKMAEIIVAAEGKKGNVITMVEAIRKIQSEIGIK